MKKLLGILGTITIAGSGMTGIMGNTPIQEKNEVSYLQTNNLEKLNRNKRETRKNISFLKTISISADTDKLLDNKPVVYNENIIYFITSEKVIEYNLENMVSRVVLKSNKNLKFGVVLHDSLYIISLDGSIFKYSPKDGIKNNIYNINDNNGVNPFITYGVVLNESIYFVTNISYGQNKIYKYTPSNNSIEVIFKDFRIENLEFDNSDGLSKITFVHNNKYYKYFGSNEPIETNILYQENLLPKPKEKISLYKNEYFFSNDNFTLYERNIDDSNKNEIYKYKKFYDEYKRPNNWIFELNGRVYFESQDGAKFNEYYSFESILVNEPIFNSWIKNFEDWIKELKTINISLLSKNEASNKIQIFLQYLREFNQNLEILRNKENIRELSSRISVVENNILNLKNKISFLMNKLSGSSSNDKLTNCSNFSGLISASTGWIPVVGTFFSGVSGTIGAICTIAANT